MNTPKTLLLMVAFFGMAVGTYFLISPYENCKREQMAKFEGQDASAMGVSVADLVNAICAKTTNW
jgi:hypothetical protein